MANKTIIGKKFFQKGTISVTDPCYDSFTWCRIDNLPIKEGTYVCSVVEEDKGEWGKRVTSIWLEPDIGNLTLARNAYKRIGAIGVDAGLAGFFQNKPDYNDDEWAAFCDNMKPEENAWIVEEGFYSSSGYGDGSYPVYGVKNNRGEYIALMIKFI